MPCFGVQNCFDGLACTGFQQMLAARIIQCISDGQQPVNCRMHINIAINLSFLPGCSALVCSVVRFLLQSTCEFSVHENPTADEEADISAQLRELHFELAEARERIEQIEDARQRVSWLQHALPYLL